MPQVVPIEDLKKIGFLATVFDSQITKYSIFYLVYTHIPLYQIIFQSLKTLFLLWIL